MNLKLYIKKLGKIKNSKIELHPFTILFGESNTNKSYTLFSMYYIYKFFFEKNEVIKRITNEFNLKKIDIKVINCEKIKENIELKKHIKDLINVFCEGNKDKKIKKIEIDINSFKNNINKLFFKGINEFFEYLINYNPNFEGKLHIPKSNFKILNKKVEKINIYYVYEREYLEYMLTFENQNLKKEIFFFHSWRNLLHKDENYLKYEEDYKNIFYFALPTLLKHFKLIEDENFFKNKDKYKLKRLYFFPPSRSAIVDMQKSLLGMYITDIPIYSGMVKEFLKTYLPDFNIIASSKDNFLDIEFKNIINEIFEGEISVEHEKMETFYMHHNTKIPISASASSIRELTPFYITLRYYPIENKIFFIEEPEAHLHPSLQKKIAYLLAYIVNKGGKVYITTHSDYLVNTISNLVKIWFLKKKNKEKAKAIMKKYNIKEEFLINPKKLGVYFFNKNEKEEVNIEKIKPSENGISPESFLKVMEEDIELSQDILEAFAEVEG
ncbi:MAG: hypothetical protein DSY60_04055 [Persephonella sp.]|nr:MAG: hypothetical protein DSY60_04055 [Persephonella sp.]